MEEAMKRTRYEQETSITFNNEEAEAILWTCQPVMLRKFAKLGIKPMRDDGEGKAFKIPKKWVKISVRKPQNLTDEQRRNKAESFKARLNAQKQAKLSAIPLQTQKNA